MSQQTKLDKALKSVKNQWIVVWIILALLLIQALGNVADTIQTLDDFRIRYFSPKEISEEEELRNRALELSESILRFVHERRQNEPQTDFHNWNEYIEASSKYSQETQSIFYTNFSSEVIYLRNEFLKRGIKDEEFEMFYKRPTNPIGLEIVGSRLGALAYQLG